MTDKSNRFTVEILWGQTRVPGDMPCFYEFNTQKELDAFLWGVEEASGWLEYELVNEPEVKQHEADTDD